MGARGRRSGQGRRASGSRLFSVFHEPTVLVSALPLPIAAVQIADVHRIKGGPWNCTRPRRARRTSGSGNWPTRSSIGRAMLCSPRIGAGRTSVGDFESVPSSAGRSGSRWASGRRRSARPPSPAPPSPRAWSWSWSWSRLDHGVDLVLVGAAPVPIGRRSPRSRPAYTDRSLTARCWRSRCPGAARSLRPHRPGAWPRDRSSRSRPASTAPPAGPWPVTCRCHSAAITPRAACTPVAESPMGGPGLSGGEAPP